MPREVTIYLLSLIDSFDTLPLCNLQKFPGGQDNMEPLSGAASIITVASLAIQLCDSMKKVYGFWQSIKDGPDEIAHITAEISIFMKWLTIIANRYQRQFDGVHKESEAAAIDALELCQQVVERMRKITNNTENDLAGKKHQRPWTLIKAAFRKERIERMLQDTERMKSLMILVQTCCIGYSPFSLRCTYG